mmetsp:Transcript_23619/g.38465  ORF Transcript_23619/g.38465 Transcript_23619/m.38465 type:complete len:109 (-) Transcript_23619:508-834(-)
MMHIPKRFKTIHLVKHSTLPSKGTSIYLRRVKICLPSQDHCMVTIPDDSGRLPLHTAIHNNASLGSVKLRVKGNPHALQSADNSGSLPLHLACQHHDSATVIQHLIDL